MTDLKARIRRVEQRLAPTCAESGTDWHALFEHVARHGKRLVDVLQEQ